jgi:predicted Zn-ribbon and HTH transcriptional regulator
MKTARITSSRESYTLDNPPKCEECNVDMDRYFESPDTMKDGWVCHRCGWSFDDPSPTKTSKRK